MPKLFRMNLVIAALEYLHTQKGPLSFNLWNVYNGRQLLLWQNEYTLHSSICLGEVLIKYLLGISTALGTVRDTPEVS